MSIKILTEDVHTFQNEDSSDVPLVDIVAIHGLYENAVDTWTDPTTSLLWLRDIFPHRQYKARVLTYEYRSGNLMSPGEGSTDRTLPYANSLIAELCADRELSDASHRPIIFICHGFGGILLKRALVLSSASRAKHLEHRRFIYTSTYAILFMGTPHNGMTKDAVLMPMKKHSAGPSQFMLSLLTQSEMLQDVTDQFLPLMKQFYIYYFWEQIATRNGKSSAYIVTEESAAPAWDVADRCGIMATHSGMVKFGGPRDHGYQVILGALVRSIKAAPETIKLRWQHDQQMMGEERRKEAEALLLPEIPRFPSSDNLPMDVNQLYLVPRRSSNYFTGRKIHTKILKESFSPIQHHIKGQERKVFVVYGLGGSGKTQFCLKFVEESMKSYRGIFWIDASNEAHAESGFAYLGQQAGRGSNFAAGLHWLSNYAEPWLLVIDNADDPDMDVSKFFPTGDKGHILITTRNPETTMHASAGHFHFRGMDPEEAITLLLRSAHESNAVESFSHASRDLAKSIASELGYLALALTYAGATIRRKIYTLERYLHHYLGHRKEMISFPNVNNVDDANIITTWEIPFRKIASRKSTEYQDAVDIMHIFAFLHFESIPERIFQTFWNSVNGSPTQMRDTPEILRSKSVWDEEAHARIRRALRVLCDHSIVDHEVHTNDQGVCSLHPVVHDWARGRLTLVEQKRWAGCATTVLAECISPHLEASGREFRRLLLPHIDTCLRALHSLFPSFPETIDQASQLARFASVYAEHGLWRQARDWQRKVVVLLTKKIGKRHSQTLQARSALGLILWNLFEIKEAAEVQRDVLITQWVMRPSLKYWLTSKPWYPDHTAYLIALNDLTPTLWLAGRRDLSQRTGERALKGLLDQFGPDDPLTLSAMFNLARTYLHVGAPKTSQELLVLVVRKRKKLFGSDHVDTLMARNELGMCYRALGRLLIAHSLVTNVVRARKRTLGAEHAYTLWSINDLSKVACDLERQEEALIMLEEILPIVIRTLGENHIGTVMTRSNLARAYGLCKKWNEADALLRKVLDRVPSDHPDWIHAMAGYTHVRLKLGRIDEVERDCRNLLDIIERTQVVPLDSSRAISIGEMLSWVYQSQGRIIDSAALKDKMPGISGGDIDIDRLFDLA